MLSHEYLFKKAANLNTNDSDDPGDQLKNCFEKTTALVTELFNEPLDANKGEEVFVIEYVWCKIIYVLYDDFIEICFNHEKILIKDAILVKELLDNYLDKKILVGTSYKWVFDKDGNLEFEWEEE